MRLRDTTAAPGRFFSDTSFVVNLRGSQVKLGLVTSACHTKMYWYHFLATYNVQFSCFYLEKKLKCPLECQLLIVYTGTGKGHPKGGGG